MCEMPVRNRSAVKREIGKMSICSVKENTELYLQSLNGLLCE